MIRPTSCEEIKSRNYLGIRHLQGLLLFWGLAVGYAMRINLSVSIIAMTDPLEEKPYAQIFDWSESVKSLLLSSFFCGYVGTQVPAGPWARKWGAKILFFYAILISAVLCLLTPYLVEIGDWPLFVFVRILKGLAQGVLFPCTHTVLSKWSPAHERASLCTFAYAGTFFGAILIFGNSGWIMTSALGWTGTFYLSGVLGVVWCIVWYIWGANTPDDYKGITIEEKTMIYNSLGTNQNNDSEIVRNLKTPWTKILTSLPFLVLMIDHCAHNWGFWTLLTQLPSYMKYVLGMDIKSNALYSSLPYAIMLMLSFIFCFIANYINKHRLLTTNYSRKLFNSIGQGIPMIALITLAFCDSSNILLAVILIILTVGFNAASFLGFQVNHIDLSPNFAGVLMGITNCAANVMSILAPLAKGLLVQDETNIFEWRLVFIIAGGFYGIANLLFVTLGKTKIQPWNDPLPEPAEMQLMQPHKLANGEEKERQ
ncbi:putative inorganic phosphate cotransporter [Lucilia cuprina]|uniref:putative inorganic phosphate cotransporter n=1 Tax=Lucilia cuprina TaxID=7375 RepID=UPI001F059E18|nr:putative inorganic phosphate cotransporter [Lucilia cuprina]XP_046811654.1 putative inorganic phosphate cotransporter [Lucilia cuprina]